MKSLKKQLILIMILLVTIPFLISNAMGYIFISRGFYEKLEDTNQNLSALISSNVSLFVEKAYSVTDDIAHIKDVVEFDEEEQKNVLVNTPERYPFFDLLYIQGTDGMQTARSSGENGDRSGRWWFQQLMSDQQPFVSKSYYSVNGNVPVTSIIVPIYDNNKKLTGVMGSDLKLDALQTMVETYSKSKNSYVYILDGEGVVIAHPDKQQVSDLYNYLTLTKTVLVKDQDGKVKVDEKGNQVTESVEIKVPAKLKEITQNALEGKSGIAEYKNEDGKEVISAYHSVTLPGVSDNWAIITVENRTQAMSFVTDYLKNNLSIALILILITVGIAYFISNSITKPIKNIMKLMEKASEGDLTVKSNHKSKNEIGILSVSFSNMIAKIRNLIDHIDELGETVTKSSETLSTTTLQMTNAIEEVSLATNEVAMGAGNQAKDAEVGVAAVTELSFEIESITNYISQSKDFSDKIYSSTVKGMEIIDQLAEKTSESNRVGKEVVQTVEELNHKANEINAILQTILGISEQTNLLALNASIEAARAGEAGKGFNVVAEEIRKLATSTRISSNNVKDIINAIQGDVKKTQDTIMLSQAVSEEQTKAVVASGEVFTEISKGIEGIVTRIDKMTDELRNINSNREKVVAAIENISAVSEETAASSEEVSASIEEQNAVSEQVGALAEELYQISKKLETAINTFITK